MQNKVVRVLVFWIPLFRAPVFMVLIFESLIRSCPFPAEGFFLKMKLTAGVRDFLYFTKRKYVKDRLLWMLKGLIIWRFTTLK